MKYKKHLLEKSKSNDPGLRSINLKPFNSTHSNFLSILQGRPYLLSLSRFVWELRKPSNIWFIFIIILCCQSTVRAQESLIIHLVLLFLILLLKYLKLHKSFTRHFAYEKSLNISKYLTFESPSFVSKASEDLQEGEVFLLRQNDSVPCDSILLSLDVSSEKLFIQLTELDNSGALETKKPLKETHNLLTQDGITVQQLLNLIDSVKVSQPQVCFETVSGKVKIKGCPTAVLVKYKNFLRAGSKVVSSADAVCLAVYIGVESKKWLDYRLEDRKVSFVFRSFEGFFEVVLTTFAVFVLCFQFSLSKYYQKPGEKEEIFQVFLDYSGFFPVFYYFGREIWTFFDFFTVAEKMLKVENISSLPKLASVEYVLAEKSGVLTENEVKVQICQVSGRFYSLLKDPDPELLSYKESEAEELPVPDLKTESIKKLSFSDLRRELVSKSIESDVWVFSIAALLTLNFYPKPPHFKNPADKAIFQFFSDLGLVLTEKTEKSAKISFKSSEISFLILASSRDSQKEETFFLVSMQPDVFFMIFASPTRQKVKFSSENLKKHFFSVQPADWHVLKELPGLCSRFYYYQSLSFEQADALRSSCENAQNLLVDKKRRVSQLFQSFSSRLLDLGCLSYENLPAEDSSALIKDLQERGIQLWMASSASEASLKASALSLGLLENDSEVCSLTGYSDPQAAYAAAHDLLTKKLLELRLEGPEDRGLDGPEALEDRGLDGPEALEDPEAVLSTLRDTKAVLMIHPLLKDLGLIREAPSEKQNKKPRVNRTSSDFFLFVSGPVLRMAFSSADLLREIVVLAFLAKRSFFCRMFPEQKRRLVKVIQENFQFQPKVLALAASDGGFKMIAEAEVGVRVFNGPISKESFFADFSVGKLRKVQDLLEKGRKIFEKTAGFALMTGFYVACHLTVLVLNEINAGFNGNFLEMWMVTIFYFFAAGFSALACCLAETSEEIKGNYFRVVFLKYQLVLMIVSGVLHACFIFFFTENLLKTFIDSSGKTSSTDDLAFLLHVQCSVALIIQSINLKLPTCKKLLLVVFGIFLTFLPIILATVSKSLNLDFSLFSATLWIFLVLFTCLSTILSTLLNFLAVLARIPSNRVSKYSKNLLEVFKNQVKWKCAMKDVNFKLDKKTMTFKNLIMESEFMFTCFQSIKVHLRIYLGMLVLIHSLLLILFELGLQDTLNLGKYLLIPAAFYSFLILLTFTVKTEDFRVVECTFFISLSALLVFKPIANPNQVSITVYPLLFLMFAFDLHTRWKYSLTKSVVLYFISLFSTNYELTHSSHTSHSDLSDSSNIGSHSAFWSIIMLVTGCLVLSASYFKDLHRRNEFVYEKQLALEVEKSSTILSYLLPSFLQKKAKSGLPYFLQEKGNVSVVFVEICDFDEVVKLHDPLELTSLLDLVFSRIDFICQASGVCKIETVGKTYMASAGLKESEEGMDCETLSVSHARRAVEMALAVIQESQKLRLKNGQKVRFKVGVNSGPVSAGVVGYHKPQFSLVGDTVNTASRMASTLTEDDAVQISLNTFELLDDLKGLAFRDSRVLVKGKGMMNTKLVSFSQESSEKSLYEGPRATSRRDSVSKSFQLRTQSRKSSIMASLDIENSTELAQRQTSLTSRSFFTICKESHSEEEFRDTYSQEIWKKQRIGLVLSFIGDSLLIICEVFLLAFNAAEQSKSRLAVESLANFLIFLTFFQKSLSKSQYFCYFLSFFYTLQMVGFFISSWLSDSGCLIYMLFFYKFTLLNFFTGTLFKKSLVFNFFSIILWSSDLFLNNYLIIDICLTLTFVVCTWYSVYQEEHKMRTNSVLKRLANQEITKTYDLLTQMMPPKALENLEEGIQVIDRISQATVMYADIVGFTQWSASRGSAEVVGMLGQLFIQFDQLCVKHSVYKVHTIGDCYVAMGFRSEKARNPQKEAENVVKLALDVVQVVENLNAQNGFALAMRIGVHTGEVIGGITGTKVVRYDIYGPDVLIANKMESYGKAGSVSVSESTKNLVKEAGEGFLFERSGEFFVNCLQTEVKTYVVRFKD